MQVLERVGLRRITGRPGCLDGDVGQLGKGAERVEIAERRRILFQPQQAAMIDDQFQSRMRLGNLPELRQEQPGHGGDWNAFLLGGRPDPVELALM